MALSPLPLNGGRRTRKVHAGLKAKTLKRMLKAKGKKTTGKKATLLKRLKMRGGADEPAYGGDAETVSGDVGTAAPSPSASVGGRRRSRRRE